MQTHVPDQLLTAEFRVYGLLTCWPGPTGHWLPFVASLVSLVGAVPCLHGESAAKVQGTMLSLLISKPSPVASVQAE